MNVFFYLVICFIDTICDSVRVNLTRRILRGMEVGNSRPYMLLGPAVSVSLLMPADVGLSAGDAGAWPRCSPFDNEHTTYGSITQDSRDEYYNIFVYLRPKSNWSTDQIMSERDWLCGGAIIHPQYILTSAACIEDVEKFYVVSGTHRWVPLGEDDECIKNGAKKAIWKCVPKDYVFDGKQFENIRWMIKDIAVVKVEDEFNFEKRVRGCDFIPKMIAFNNKSKELEAPGTTASIAGWGSIESFLKAPERTSLNSPELLETDVLLISKKNCKKRWPERYHSIIDNHMVCGKDGLDADTMSVVCREHQVNCKELEYSDESDLTERRYMLDSEDIEVHSALHRYGSVSLRKGLKKSSGGFCMNDHGGPLVVGHGYSAIVIGVISACMTTPTTQKCFGPFLYTSVWNNRHVISCAIDKDMEASCRRLYKTENIYLSKTYYDWSEQRMPRGRRGNTSYTT